MIFFKKNIFFFFALLRKPQPKQLRFLFWLLLVCLLSGRFSSVLWAFDWDYYTIQKGDSLLKIARQYDISAGEISFWNNISNPNHIQVGQRLRVLRGSTNMEDILRLDEKEILKLWKGHINFFAPLSSWQVVSPYNTWGENKNYGVWLRTNEKIRVAATASGKISQIGYLRGYGNFILIDHQNGWLSLYSAIENISVKEGQTVQRGQTLAKCSQTKLFFLTSYKGHPVNPEEIVKR